MSVAIENFLQLNALNKVMVLDDMFELGAESFQEHKAIVELLSNEKNIVSFFHWKGILRQSN
jgi:UDP-N-acetylmuramoyl-tripeptide--D-alanyl-D-alanine ligase